MAYADDYVKKSWQNSPSQATPINQTNLNHIEQGIKTNCTRISTMSGTLDGAVTDIGNLQTDVGNAQNDITALQTGKQDALTFDNAPTKNSNNPVKSGGVYSALLGKQDTLTFDNTPTSGSQNPVTSDGVYQALTGAGVGTLAGLVDVDITDPQNGDSLVYDSVSQKWVNVGAPPGVNVTLTLNGAKNDVITIKDSNNETVGTCTFTAGQTSGTTQITVPVGGGTYKFKSSVAKIKSGGTVVDYEKTVALTDAPSQAVNVFPKNVLYWYGNENVEMSNGIWTNAMADVTKNANSLRVNYPANSNKYLWYCTDNIIDLSRYTKVHTAINIRTFPSGNKVYIYSSSSRDIGSGTPSTHLLETFNSTTSGMDVLEATFSVNEQNYVGIRSQFYDEAIDVELSALWLDDGHEDDITIIGAKEDAITITNSQNQTVATCIFGSGKTYGYVSKALLPSGTYTFTSSVAKMKSDGSVVDYAKTITLDGSETEIKVMPDGVLTWYGNAAPLFSLAAVAYGTYEETQSSATRFQAPTITQNTNSTTITYKYQTSYHCVGTVYTPAALTGKTKIKCATKRGSTGPAWMMMGTVSTMQQGYTPIEIGSVTNAASIDISELNISGSGDKIFLEGCLPNGSSTNGSSELYALWVE